MTIKIIDLGDGDFVSVREVSNNTCILLTIRDQWSSHDVWLRYDEVQELINALEEHINHMTS